MIVSEKAPPFVVDLMHFVELNRSFARLEKDKAPNLELGSVWGHKLGEWLAWSDLITRQRVILLAEASSGKSEEFKNQSEKLVASGCASFVIRIEEIADLGFESALDLNAAKAFNIWPEGTADGWFFLDSVDEARLNRKNFETALKRFARELGSALERAHIFISCRVTDWKGPDDYAAVTAWLPAWKRADPPSQAVSDNDALLGPIFNKSEETVQSKPPENKEEVALLVVQLVPLSTEQYLLLAKEAGVAEPREFAAGIVAKRLEAFTERPGDLLDLVSYWQEHMRFGSLSEMVAHSISRKLKERDTHRPDNQTISLDRAEEGARRLAAALTLGKSFTLKVPNHDPDPSLAVGALDPAAILPDWNEAERNALLRRGIFAPATYGRIRFHHRSTQEYLTASWLEHLLQSNCPQSEVLALLFTNRYGVDTVVPSLRSAAAWLAPKYPAICDELIRREPLALLNHGDPSLLSMRDRERLLTVFAEMQARGDVANDSVDARALVIFADQALAPTIRNLWQAYHQPHFRFTLLRLIRDGRILGCNDLVQSVAIDPRADRYHRVVGVQALKECHDKVGLTNVARLLHTTEAPLDSALASACAEVLYPDYLSTKNLIELVSRSTSDSCRITHDFAYTIQTLYDATPDAAARAQFVAGLADLCLQPPFRYPYRHISARHQRLASYLYGIAKRELKTLGAGKPPAYLIQLLLVVERADRQEMNLHGDSIEDFRKSISSNHHLNRDLFWANVEFVRAHAKSPDHMPIHYWHIIQGSQNGSLWQLDEAALPWLYRDLSDRALIDDRRIVLSAILAVLHRSNRLVNEIGNLRASVGDDAQLNADIEDYLRVPEEDKRNRKYRLEEEKRQKKAAAIQERDKASWVRFSETLREDPSVLARAENLVSWSAGVFRLADLRRWLGWRLKGHERGISCSWRILEEGFGRDVAEAYRDGMMRLWRVTKPRRPKRAPGGITTTRWETIFAVEGIAVEASENSEWASHLSHDEALLAAKHGCMANQGYPQWIEALVRVHPKATLPVLQKEIKAEWIAPEESGLSSFLYQYSSPTVRLHPDVQAMLFSLMIRHDAGRLATLDLGLRIVRNLDIDDTKKGHLIATARKRFGIHRSKGNADYELRYLALLLLLQPDVAVNDFVGWLENAPKDVMKSHVENAFGMLFDRHDSLIAGVLDSASVATLEKFLVVAYKLIRPEDDAVHEGAYSPNARDKAENARSWILSALINRPGPDAYWAVKQAASSRIFQARQERFSEIAREKAERDSETTAWMPSDVLIFERQFTSPVRQGIDLFNLVMMVLREIASSLTQGDTTSRPLLERAMDENEVQHWISEQLSLRSRGRFHVYREAQVSDGNKPDIIVASTSAPCEVALEIKHGGKKWTAKQLDNALRHQLAIDYLKTPSRRYGIFIVTHHRNRSWKHPVSGQTLGFEQLIEWLSETAMTLHGNDTGAVGIACIGINSVSPIFLEPT